MEKKKNTHKLFLPLQPGSRGWWELCGEKPRLSHTLCNISWRKEITSNYFNIPLGTAVHCTSPLSPGSHQVWQRPPRNRLNCSVPHLIPDLPRLLLENHTASWYNSVFIYSQQQLTERHEFFLDMKVLVVGVGFPQWNAVSCEAVHEPSAFVVFVLCTWCSDVSWQEAICTVTHDCQNHHADQSHRPCLCLHPSPALCQMCAFVQGRAGGGAQTAACATADLLPRRPICATACVTPVSANDTAAFIDSIFIFFLFLGGRFFSSPPLPLFSFWWAAFQLQLKCQYNSYLGGMTFFLFFKLVAVIKGKQQTRVSGDFDCVRDAT